MGIPQSSILGPNLFVIILNDIVYGLDAGTHIMIYADDTKIWMQMEHQDNHLKF